jgi:selenium-binding protein 1
VTGGHNQGDFNPGGTRRTDQLPPILKGFKACPPFVTDIDLSVDDKYLYVSCWGTGDFHQYDVSDPFKPKLTGKLRIGGSCLTRSASEER